MSDDGDLAVRALRDDLLELAERYETVAALDLHTTSWDQVMRTAPGSRVPPGAQQILDVDEVERGTTAVDDWAEFLVHVLVDECDVTAPDSTPARIRLAAGHAAHFVYHEDVALWYAVNAEAVEHLRTLRHLSGRGVRRIRTGHRCHTGCGGQYVSPLGTSEDRHEDALRCEKCGHEVPFIVWSHWPRARVKYVTPEHAARMLGTTVNAVRILAHRRGWKRVGTGRDVRYEVDSIKESAG